MRRGKIGEGEPLSLHTEQDTMRANKGKSQMRNMVRWFDALPPLWSTILSAFGQAAPFYAAALLRHSISEIAKQASLPALAVHASVVVILLTLVLAVRGYFGAIRRDLHQQAEKKRALLERAHDIVDRIVSESLSEIADAHNDTAGIEILFSSKRHLTRIVKGVYELFEGGFGTGDPEGGISFETTFMTKSYRDHNITIPAYANRDGRAPHSLTMRDSNIGIYENTVSASVYKDQCPVVKIVEDTEATPTYSALYDGQKKRIQSTIVYPVRDAQNRLLGTLVVHCDKKRFFRTCDERDWARVLEIFSKRLAHEKSKMDRAARLHGTTGSESLKIPELPF
jgi:GAF domain-containing protein